MLMLRVIGYTALMIASIGGHKDIAKLLLENEADVNAKNDDEKYGVNYCSKS